MSKVVASRDTRLDSGGTRKQRISSFFQGSSGKEIRRLYRSKPENPRIGLDRKSGQAFLDHEVFTKGHRLDFHSGKTVDQPIPSRETEDSPKSASTGESPLRKRGVGIFFSRRESTLS